MTNSRLQLQADVGVSDCVMLACEVRLASDQAAGRFTANNFFVLQNGDCNFKTARKETLVFPTKAVPSTSAPLSE